MTTPTRGASLLGVALLVAACAPSFERQRGRAQDEASRRLGVRALPPPPPSDDPRTPEEVRRLLAHPLSADSVVRIALLNNRELVAAFGELGVARGRLLQATTPPNPTLDELTVRFPLEGDDAPTYQLSVVQGLTESVLLPLRRAAADAEVEAATVAVTSTTLALAFAARRAWIDYLSAEQELRTRREVLAVAAAALEAASQLHEAGNVAAVDLQTQQAFHGDCRIAVSRAETARAEARERLNVLMGLWGADVRWTAASLELPPPAAEARELRLARVERRAIERSLDLQRSRLRILAAARHTTYARVAGVVPDVELGISAETDRGTWSLGPTLRATLPLFDQGRGRTAAIAADLDRLRAGHVALAVRIRAAARALRARLEGARERALHYRAVVLPLRQSIAAERLLEFNAMQVGVFELLDAQRALVEAGALATAELRGYWMARFELEQLLAGRLPPGAPGAEGSTDLAAAAAGAAESAGGGH